MGNFIVEHKMGISVYGLEQLDYTVDGTSGCDFGKAVSLAALKRAAGVEGALNAFTAVVRKRQTKLDELSKALAVVSQCAAQFASDAHTGDSVSNDGLTQAFAYCDKYGVDRHGASGTSIKRSEVQLVQTSIQYAIDMENTDLQQDMVQMQSFVDKRESAFRLANTLLKKTNNTISTGIRNIQ